MWRGVQDGAPGYVLHATVVCDDNDIIGLYQHSGSVCKRRSGKRGGPSGRNMLPGGWDGKHVDKVWNGPATLHLHKMGTDFTVIRSWSPASERYEGWYVNLEDDWIRTEIGFDSRDLMLDVTVTEDLSEWTLKDADELAWAVEQGSISEFESDRRHQIAKDAAERVENKDWPFRSDWSQWNPEPDWLSPTIPAKWNAPCVQ